jgi:hypothetical protein
MSWAADGAKAQTMVQKPQARICAIGLAAKTSPLAKLLKTLMA